MVLKTFSCFEYNLRDNIRNLTQKRQELETVNFYLSILILVYCGRPSKYKGRSIPSKINLDPNIQFFCIIFYSKKHILDHLNIFHFSRYLTLSIFVKIT